MMKRSDQQAKLDNNTYFAVCDAKGPISVQLAGFTEREALASFAKIDGRAAIDHARTDIEDHLGLTDCESMSERAFAESLEAAGAVRVRGLEPIVNAHAGTVADLAGGWSLWKVVA